MVDGARVTVLADSWWKAGCALLHPTVFDRAIRGADEKETVWYEVFWIQVGVIIYSKKNRMAAGFLYR